MISKYFTSYLKANE